MFHLALFEPEIPPNTGNIIRLCANVGCALHLIHPLGFLLDDRRLRRAGLDYHEWASVQEYASWEQFRCRHAARRIFACSTRGKRVYSEIEFREEDLLLFGPETRGLPPEILSQIPLDRCLRIPMRPGNRSLNLANAAALILYEAWRQHGYAGGG